MNENTELLKKIIENQALQLKQQKEALKNQHRR